MKGRNLACFILTWTNMQVFIAEHYTVRWGHGIIDISFSLSKQLWIHKAIAEWIRSCMKIA